jgi:hypothetical protein
VKGYERLLAAVGRLVMLRHPDRGDEIVETARLASHDGNAWGELASLVALALRPSSVRAVWLHGALLATALTAVAAVTPVALIVPFGLLVLGVLDARLAAAATVFWLFRLLTADLADPQLLRWLAMLAGVVLAAHVTRTSIRRAAAL